MPCCGSALVVTRPPRDRRAIWSHRIDRSVTRPSRGCNETVRIGPYANPDEMAKARTLLAQNGIEASVVRVKDGKDTKDAAN